MIVINGNILTEKGNLKRAVREAARDTIKGVYVELSNGKQVELECMGSGNYFGTIGKGEDSALNAKVSLVITPEEYKEPAKATRKAAEKEELDFVIED